MIHHCTHQFVAWWKNPGNCCETNLAKSCPSLFLVGLWFRVARWIHGHLMIDDWWFYFVHSFGVGFWRCPMISTMRWPFLIRSWHHAGNKSFIDQSFLTIENSWDSPNITLPSLTAFLVATSRRVRFRFVREIFQGSLAFPAGFSMVFGWWVKPPTWFVVKPSQQLD